MKKAPIYIVDVIGEVVAATDAVLFPTLNKHILYTYGRNIQVLQKLQSLNNSMTLKNTKYPLFALWQDFPEDNGNTAYYCKVKFPMISIAMLTVLTDDPPTRYSKTFKPVLYPIYQEFLRQCARHKNIVVNDPGTIPHVKWDRPGIQVKDTGVNDYVDAIELQNLELTFKQVNICKPS